LSVGWLDLLDTNVPVAWLAALLDASGFRFAMDWCDDGGSAATRKVPRSSADEVRDRDCLAYPPKVGLVRQTAAPNGKGRRLVTDLDAQRCACALYGTNYHQYRHIAVAFNQLNCRARLESVLGLSPRAPVVDVAAKVLTTDMTSLMCAAAVRAHLSVRPRKYNRSYTANRTQ
jgi:hypothetical protein